jgi:hypothetical protein
MMKKISINLTVLLGLTFLFSASAFSYNPKNIDSKTVARANQKLTKMMPILENQVELIVKMITNDKYRAKLEDEFKLVIGCAGQGAGGGGRSDHETDYDYSSWCIKEFKRDPQMSFLASVLKQYKAPLTKTCFGNTTYRGGHQPLYWSFPLEFLSGSMMLKNKSDRNVGFGVARLNQVDKADLIKLAEISNKVVELQRLLRDGIDGMFDDDVLQTHASYTSAGSNYHIGTAFGDPPGRRNQGPCDWYEGQDSHNGNKLIGYEMILPAEIVKKSRVLSYLPKYSFGGGVPEAAADFNAMPAEYIDAWKNLTSFYMDYLPFLPGDSFYNIIDRYDEVLAGKAEEPVGDLMSDDSDTDKTDSSTDDDLALPSLD